MRRLTGQRVGLMQPNGATRTNRVPHPLPARRTMSQ